MGIGSKEIERDEVPWEAEKNEDQFTIEDYVEEYFFKYID